MRARMVDLNPDDEEGMGKAVMGGDVDINSGGRGDFGGHGLFMTAPGYLAVLRSLLANDGTLLRAKTVEENLFGENHLTTASEASLQEKLNGPPLDTFFRSGTRPGTKMGFGLGGILTLEEEPGFYGKGTLSWGGGLTLAWFIDRTNGLCGVGAMQAKLPLDREAALELKQVFRKGVYRKREQWDASQS